MLFSDWIRVYPRFGYQWGSEQTSYSCFFVRGNSTEGWNPNFIARRNQELNLAGSLPYSSSPLRACYWVMMLSCARLSSRARASLCVCECVCTECCLVWPRVSSLGSCLLTYFTCSIFTPINLCRGRFECLAQLDAKWHEEWMLIALRMRLPYGMYSTHSETVCWLCTNLSAPLSVDG